MAGFLKVLFVGLPLMFGALWLFSRLDEHDARRRQLSPADYEACIRAYEVEFVQNCYREKLASDMKMSREELPSLPSREERLQQCKTNLMIAREKLKYYSSPCGKKPE